MKAASCMTKAQATEFLQTFGETAPPSWTSIEIKSRIGELQKLSGQDPRTKPLGVSTKDKKEAIKQACVDNGVDTTENMTKGQLLRKLREKREQVSEPSADNLMTFGKWSGETFQNIKMKDPGYCEWATTTVSEGAAHWKLQQFVRWLTKDTSARRTPSSSSAACAPMGYPEMPKQNTKNMYGMNNYTVGRKAIRRDPEADMDLDLTQDEQQTAMRQILREMDEKLKAQDAKLELQKEQLERQATQIGGQTTEGSSTASWSRVSDKQL